MIGGGGAYSFSGQQSHRVTSGVAFIFLVFLCFSFTLQSQGRAILNEKNWREEKTTIMCRQIGSRPPRCERRCLHCGHCEAVQVPATKHVISGYYYDRGNEVSSNYKPMSWMCKCGNSLFNP